jgi:CRP/FNR family transcriptional regulator, anaerobic regulatory protein
MFEAFKIYLKVQAGIADGDIELICSKATLRVVRRKEHLLQHGDVCKFKGFVLSGMLRTYTVKADGSEHILQFTPENFWITEPQSYDTGEPSIYCIDALEHSEVMLWTKKDFDEIRKQIPVFQEYSLSIIARNSYLNRQRILSAISTTAEERYEEFMQNNPNIAARVPLHMVASYLGVSRETLSRIRHVMAKAK